MTRRSWLRAQVDGAEAYLKFGVLSDLFDGAGAKYLSAVEIDQFRSNQHEFQGVGSFRAFLGTPSEKLTFPATFWWLTDNEDEPPHCVSSFCTWSDVRRNRPGRSPEYHLYYGSEAEAVTHRARPGDLLVIARKKDGSLLALLSAADSTIGAQLLWLFGLDLLSEGPTARDLGSGDRIALGLAARTVLDDLGIDVEDPQTDAFDRLVNRFGLSFPGTAEFSAFARETLPGFDPVGAPDDTLMAWMEHEEALFRQLEREVVAERLKQGFFDEHGADVSGFLKFSLSVQNRRKSRAGYAFGHHTAAILSANNLRYTREATTEKRNAADFLFPGEQEYQNKNFPADRLVMLAVKTTCKDRWRQVLAEADRIREKHLLTLEPAISRTQTAEMQAQNLKLVLPRELHKTFHRDQRGLLSDVEGFLDNARSIGGANRAKSARGDPLS